MKSILLSIPFTFLSCSAEPLQIEPVIKQQSIEAPKNEVSTFTVEWSSNQTGAYIELTTYVFRNCEIISEETKVYTDKKFNVVLENNQRFTIQIKREATIKNPKLSLNIYKGSELQYSEKVDAYGYLYTGIVDESGNIN